MQETYDAIVIGAGLGGLSAAATLASHGRRVLLLERHNIPGGYATSFVRGRYEFEIALHELSGIGPPERRGALHRHLAAIGVADRITFLPVDEIYRSIFPDLDIVLPRGWEAYETTLCETFPHEASGIRRFLARVRALRHEIWAITRNQGVGNPLTAPFRYPNTIRYLPATWGTVLGRDVRDPLARAVLSQYWGYFGLGPGQVSFMYFAVALAAYVELGPTYVQGRSQALSNAFITALEERGGEVRFCCGVERITVSGGRVTGVITEHGDHLRAGHVISNADPISTCRDLIGDKHIPGRFFAGLRRSQVAPATINVYLGLACPPEELGLTCHENFVNSSTDLDEHHQRTRRITDPGGTLVTCYNLVDPEISPPGTTQMVLTALSYGDPWLSLPPARYVDAKNRVAEAMIRQAETIVPDLRGYAEVVEVATPLTNMRYVGALGGSIYGWSNTPWDHSVLRMPLRGPIAGLLFAGAWTQPGGGFEPCMMSGLAAAQAVAKEAGHEN